MRITFNYANKLSTFINKKFLCGKEGYSLCARFYEESKNNKKWALIAMKITDRIFFFDKQHCRKAWFRRNKQQEGLINE